MAEDGEDGQVRVVTPSKGLRWRLIFAVLGALGMAIIYGLKVNLSVTIVAMLNHTHLAAEATSHAHDDAHAVSDSHGEGAAAEVDEAVLCFGGENTTESKNAEEDGPFTWTEPQQGLVLGSYFWGYLITQIPGGRMAELFGGKWVFFVAVLMNIVPTLLSPVCSYAGFQYLIVMRIIEGLGGGLTFPAMNVLISKWAPKEERSTISAICYGGTALGTVISMPTAGLIAGGLGWEFVFYIHGGLACIWCILWALLVADSPGQHRLISVEEKSLIEQSTQEGGAKKKSPPVPWVKIFKSLPVWAIIIAHTFNNFGWYMLLVELPLFMRNGLGFNIKENAGLSCVPFLCNWLFSLVYSNRLDWAREKKYINTTWGRKLSMAIASIIPALCLVGVTLAGCDKVAVVSLMIVATLFFGSMFAGVFSNHVDIASNYAGVLMGMSNMAATIPGFAVPAFVGILTHGKPGIGPWHIVFYCTAALLIAEIIIYGLFASGVEQEWNRTEEEAKDDEEKVELKKNDEEGGENNK